MAKIERFEGKVFFEPQAQIQGFQNPSAPDLITPLRQNQQAREQERRNFAEARQAELRLQGEALKQRQMIEKAGVKNLLSLVEGGQKLLEAGEEVFQDWHGQQGLAAFYEDLDSQREYKLANQETERNYSLLDNEAEEVSLEASKNGAPYNVTSRYQQLWGRAKRMYAKAAAQHYGDETEYRNYIEKGLQSDHQIQLPDGTMMALNAPEKTEQQYASAVAYLRDEYMQVSGLAQLPAGDLAEHAFPNMQSVDGKLLKEFEKQRGDDLSVTKQAEILDTLIRDFKTDPYALSHALKGLAVTTKDGEALRFRGAWNHLRTTLVQMADNGQDVASLINKVKNDPIPNDPKGRTWGELHGTKLNRILDESYAENRNNFKNRQEDARIEYIRLRNKITQSYGPETSLSEIEEAEKRLIDFANRYGIYEGPDPTFQALKSDPVLNGDAARERAINLGFEVEASKGLLKVNEVLKHGPSIQNKWLQTAIDQEKQYNQAGGLKETLNAVKGHIRANKNVQIYGKIGELGGTEQMMTGHYQRWVSTRVNEILASGTQPDVIEANKQAFQEFQAMFNGDIADPTHEFYFDQHGGIGAPGFNNYGKNVAISTRATDLALREIREQAKADPAGYLDKPGLFGNKEFWMAESKRFLEPGFRPDARIVRWAALHKKNVLEIYNRQMQAYNLPPLPNTEQILASRQGVSAGYKRFLDNVFMGSATRMQYTRYSGGDLPVRSSISQYVPGGKVARLRGAFISQESGGDHTAVNPRTQAVGLGQVLPENVGPWTRKYLGKEMSYTQFRYNRLAQEKLLNAMFAEMFERHSAPGRSEEETVRRAAAEWYGGAGAVKHWNNPGYHANVPNEPNMAEYTSSIWRKYSR